MARWLGTGGPPARPARRPQPRDAGRPAAFSRHTSRSAFTALSTFSTLSIPYSSVSR